MVMEMPIFGFEVHNYTTRLVYANIRKKRRIGFECFEKNFFGEVYEDKEQVFS